jgi:hypothetical protein
LRLRSARELERTLSKSASPGAVAEYGETIATVKGDARALDVECSTTKNGTWVAGVKVPRFTELAESALDAAGGTGFYGGWSGSGHGQVWAVTHAFMPTFVLGQLGDLNSAQRPIWGTFPGAVSVVVVAFDRLCIWKGWAARRAEMIGLYRAMQRDYVRLRT